MSSMRHPGGNQVDGLSSASSYEFRHLFFQIEFKFAISMKTNIFLKVDIESFY